MIRGAGLGRRMSLAPLKGFQDAPLFTPDAASAVHAATSWEFPLLLAGDELADQGRNVLWRLLGHEVTAAPCLPPVLLAITLPNCSNSCLSAQGLGAISRR